ncbi:MAG: hypothetical protein KME46_09140 [Brasilonema angustatum HA4187-MV1]|jgi:hypothetical protein|nr:hypothetical protein [Brasilonema angustatum HA4187-MV1]
MDSLHKKLVDWGKPLAVGRKLLMPTAILLALIGMLAAFANLYPFEGIGEWTGIGKNSNKSETIEAEFNPKTKEIIKLTYRTHLTSLHFWIKVLTPL